MKSLVSSSTPRGAAFEQDPGKAPRRHVVTDVVTQPIHTISLLVRNKPGVLVRVALVFSRRGYNIESLVVCQRRHRRQRGPRDFSRMTITCSGDPETLEQIIKQLTKLIDVVHAIDHTGQAVVETEIALVKIQIGLKDRTEILQIAEHYKAKVVDYGAESLILRFAGESDKLDASSACCGPSASSSWSARARS